MRLLTCTYLDVNPVFGCLGCTLGQLVVLSQVSVDISSLGYNQSSPGTVNHPFLPLILLFSSVYLFIDLFNQLFLLLPMLHKLVSH